jgi:flotillin
MCCGMGFITCGPNEAIVVSGCLHSQPLTVVGGWAFVIPCVQKVQRISLNIMTIKVSSPKVYTMQGVLLSVTGIAQVKL